MAMLRSLVLPLLLAMLLVLRLELTAEAKASGKSVSARKEDVKYIKCGVCEEIVKQLHRQVKKKRDKMAPKKLSELDIIDLAENICNIKKEEADWMMFLDIVEDGSRLKLVEQQEEGECDTECKTIERACEEVMGDHDTDVAEFMYKGGTQRAALSKLLCKDLSKACVGKPPPVPKDREPGQPFRAKPSKDADLAKMMRSMGDMPGAPGMQMYSRDELLKGGGGMGMGGMGMGGEDEDDGDEDDDDDVVDKAKLRKGMLENLPQESGFVDKVQTALGSLKSGVRKGMNAGASRLRDFSGRVSKWWYRSRLSPKSRRSSRSSKARSMKSTKSEL